MKKITVLLIALSFYLSASAETKTTKLVKHELFGKIPRSQLQLFKQFEPYLKKTMEVAGMMGVYELPVQYASFKQNTTVFSKENAMPHYVSVTQKLLLGAVIDPQKLHKEEITIAIHELSHAIHTQYMMQAHGNEFIYNFYEDHQIAYMSTAQTGEFFADLITTFVLDDSSAINAGLDFYFENNLGFDLNKKTDEAKAGDDLRDFNYNESESEHSCSGARPSGKHEYYSILRKYIWNDLYKNEFNSSKEAIPVIINAVAEVGIEIGIRDEKLFNETHFQCWSDCDPRITIGILTRKKSSTLFDTTDYFTEHHNNDYEYINAVNEKLELKTM